MFKIISLIIVTINIITYIIVDNNIIKDFTIAFGFSFLILTLLILVLED